MPTTCLVKKSVIFLVSCAFFLLMQGIAVSDDAADIPEESVSSPVDFSPELWERARTALKYGNDKKAAALFLLIYQKYPESELAEESLWWSIQIQQVLKLTTPQGDWDSINALYRRFVIDFPDSSLIPTAYYNVGLSYYRMGYFRESLGYFNLFLEKFPDSEFSLQALYLRGKALLRIGKIEEARKISNELVKNADKNIRSIGLAGIGDVQFSQGKFHEAVKTYESLMTKAPSFHYENPEILNSLGKAYLEIGDVKKGREKLFYFLNLVDESFMKTQVLFDLAENYYDNGEDAVAQDLYAKIIDNGDPGDKVVIMSRFRQAQYIDDPEKKQLKWQKRGDLSDPAGDRYYNDVLDKYQSEPIAQDARYGLFMRFVARQDFDNALDAGTGFLENDTVPGRKDNSSRISGEILMYLVQELLKREEYEKIYDLYSSQHRHVAAYGNGRLLYYVGKALESMNLLDQAAVVYYRALALPLTDEEKSDLYFRRAEVYLAKGDIEAAERLLKHLRKIYRDSDEIGEVYYLSGKLEERKDRFPEALEYYGKAVQKPEYEERKIVYSQSQLRLLFQLEKHEQAFDALELFNRENWLPPEELQGWYSRLGGAFVKRQAPRLAVKAYEAALGEGLPQDSETAQAAQFHLGEIYFSLGEKEKSLEYLKTALAGPAELWSRLAGERLKQDRIDKTLLKVGSILEGK